jgi:hypothetical protein
MSFEKNLGELMEQSYDADLWAAAYIVNGGCSDDGFDYFRGWLILQGKKIFETMLHSPGRLGDYIQTGSMASCQLTLGAARSAYRKRMAGREMPILGEGPGKLKGKHLDGAERKKRFPELWERFKDV